jgi:predicted dehydrogenase
VQPTNAASSRRHLIIGTGAIAHAHAAAVADQGGRSRVVHAVDVDAARAEEFAARHGVDGWGTDLAEALAGGADVAHICTPPGSHVPLALQCLEAGVAVVLEKPPALSLAEIDVLVEASERTGVGVAVIFQHRFGAPGVRARRLLADGVLGRPYVATCDTLWFRAPEYFAVPWRGKWEVEGGGPTMGHGIHQFDLLLSILGPWTEVTAMAARLSRPTNTEDVSMALARFDNGAMATVVNSVVSPRETSRLRFDFEHATVELEHLYGYREADWRFTAAPGHEDLAGFWIAGDEPDAESGHRLQIEAVLDAIAAGLEPGVSLAEARRTLEFAAATYASAFQGRPVSVGEIAGSDPFNRSMDGGVVPWAPIKETLA